LFLVFLVFLVISAWANSLTSCFFSRHLADDATIVNVSSDLGSIGKVMNGGFNTITQDVIYRSSKAALNMVTVCAAAELKSRAPDKKIKVIR
jgi:NAD(P)-dependent dehydrogenase (short-subunit alcohol dehydrogenase family)